MLTCIIGTSSWFGSLGWFTWLVHLVHLTDSHGWFTWLFYLADSLDSVQEKWWVVDCVVHCCITGLCPLPTQQRFCFGGVILNIATYSVVRDEITAFL